MNRIRRCTLLAACLIVASLLVRPATAQAADPVVNVTPPVISGDSRVGATLTLSTGSWTPDDVTLGIQWLRNGADIPGATGPAYAPRAADIGASIAARVTATSPDRAPLAVVSAATARVAPGVVVNTTKPRVVGTLKFRKKVKADRGSWSVGGLAYSYRWLRDGAKIKGATKKTYTLGWRDVGHEVTVRVTVRKPSYTTAAADAPVRGTVKHLVRAKKTVTYSVRTRGKIRTSLRTFRKQAHETLNDPRGWRGMGVAFREVTKGGQFTLVLSQASKVPSFAPICSSYYSCRAGRNVVINQDRWLTATPMWRKAKRSIRDYRHMVVNHETGHWLGHRHAYCSKRGALAPVMQQQSKGLHGCKANPWPKTSELWSTRLRLR